MPRRGKRYQEARKKVDSTIRYPLADAVELVKAAAPAKFVESVDLAVKLGVNPRHADQMVRGACSLPHGTGKQVRVVVFADGEAARAALAELVVGRVDGAADELGLASAAPRRARAACARCRAGVGCISPISGPEIDV